MRRLAGNGEEGSGLVLAIKSIIDSPQWNNAWVWLLYTGTGSWFYVRALDWRNLNKNWRQYMEIIKKSCYYRSFYFFKTEKK